MNETLTEPRRVARITCQVHQRVSPRITAAFRELGVDTVLVENGRTVRLHKRRRPFGLPGARFRLDDSPANVFRVTVPLESERAVMEALISAAELDVPGHGSVFSQPVYEYGGTELSAVDTGGRDNASRTLLQDLVLLTCILSMRNSGDQVARLALELGSCVPFVTLGSGTGVRDQLGLLRITIPPEKEIVHLLVPDHDANEIMRLLIEQGRLDRPGRGFVYQTPVGTGFLDTSLRIGQQEHAASIEQIIAAVDELKRGTGWRKRFAALEPGGGDPAGRLMLGNREIALVCSEGRAPELLDAAIAAGAAGATTSKVRRQPLTDAGGGAVARERSVMSVPRESADRIVEALIEAGSLGESPADRIQVLDAPATFSHRR